MTDSLLPSMSLESRRCEQSIHDSRRLSKEFPEVVALLQWCSAHLWLPFSDKQRQADEAREIMARIDKCLAALKGHGT